MSQIKAASEAVKPAEPAWPLWLTGGCRRAVHSPASTGMTPSRTVRPGIFHIARSFLVFVKFQSSERSHIFKTGRRKSGDGLRTQQSPTCHVVGKGTTAAHCLSPERWHYSVRFAMTPEMLHGFLS